MRSLRPSTPSKSLRTAWRAADITTGLEFSSLVERSKLGKMMEPAIAPAFRFCDLFVLPGSDTRALSAGRHVQLPYAVEPHQQQIGSRLRQECHDLTCDVMFARSAAQFG
ncbi:hypothetical protein ACH79_39685 [Bradyrhizobium sp. CCBAU 051011]|nr:hypothetical protein ACH79_39685 [Bradyrhizobium sp. CCBAU 051011]